MNSIDWACIDMICERYDARKLHLKALDFIKMRGDLFCNLKRELTIGNNSKATTSLDKQLDETSKGLKLEKNLNKEMGGICGIMHSVVMRAGNNKQLTSICNVH